MKAFFKMSGILWAIEIILWARTRLWTWSHL